jgi:YidC/Oxa1 family membrane protein insertase
MQRLYEPIITFLSGILTGIHSLTGDWGIAIILLTLGVKVLLYRFNLSAARQMLKTSALEPHLKDLRERFGSDKTRLGEETMKLYQRLGLNPLSSFAGLLVQMPVLASMYRLFLSHGSLMSSHLIPWVNHLAEADYLHILPLAAAGLAFISSLIPVVARKTPDGTGARKRMVMALIFALIPLLITWHSPAALGLYWITGTVFGLLERAFYRTMTGKRLLQKGIPSLEGWSVQA